jgi:uncharacterized RDD family membrane protein YckC
MASTERHRVSSTATPETTERILRFAPEQVKAPFILRCAALIIDYIVLMMIPMAWLMWGKFVGDSGPNAQIGSTVWLIGVMVWLIDFLLLPLVRGQTIGKMLTGITIVRRDGADVRLVGILLRNILGYVITVLTLGIGFLIAGVNTSGRALHDYIGGTVVVRARKLPV